MESHSSLPAVPVGEPFGRTADGAAVQVFTLANGKGTRLRAINYGAIVLSLETVDKTGYAADIVLGFQTLDEYLQESPYFGAVVGRFGNRIAHGKFVLEGREYTLATNNSPGGIPCALHGGLRGFDKVVWRAEGLAKEGAQGVRFHYASPDGEEGYPGNLQVSVTYWLSEQNEWRVEYEAVTDRATPVNLTQHSFFNLKGEGQGDILGHELQLSASSFTPVDAGLIPTGAVRSVEGTPFDFRAAHAVGSRIGADDEQLRFGGGYDHNWVVDGEAGTLRPAATVFDSSSGRFMEVLTTEPAIQFYSGNFLDGSLKGKAGKAYGRRHGFCLETQHYPDSPNQPSFPSTILEPGKVLRSTTVFRLGVR